MPEVEWTAPAVADLRAIVDYISDDNPNAALAVLEAIDSRVAQLPEHPEQGRPGRVAGTRELFVRPSYVVVYGAGDETLRILRVLHGAQMWP